MPPIVRIEGVNKAFAGVTALNSAELNIAPGEVHGLIGQNGAGKSTLIKILTGVYRKDSGVVYFNGKEVNFLNPREAQDAGVSTIYQELNLVPLRSVTENIVMGYEKRRMGIFIDWQESHQRASEILGRFGLNIDVRARLGDYSTAIQQLVVIARAVSLNTKLVVMDEPTSSLDDNETEVLFGVVKELKRNGVSVIYISHFLDELFEICDRVTIMRDGRTVGVRSISETSKLELIADMLGRNIDDIRATGVTDFSLGTSTKGEVLVKADGVATGRRLTKLDLILKRGEIVGLGGLLGSGRTESARALFGVDPLTSGHIELTGGRTGQKSAAGSIAVGLGYLTEDRKSEGIIPDMTVRENLTLALLPRISVNGRIKRNREREIVNRFVKALGIKLANMEQPIRELSGGNQQKVLLARWLATEPEVLILDEPTRGIDVGAKLEVQSIIREFVEKGFGAILISSEFEELVEGADKIVVLRDGKSVTTLNNPGIKEDTLIQAIAHHSAEY